MATSALGPRVLLRRLREVMAEPETAQKRLDKHRRADRGEHGRGSVLDLCDAARPGARALCDRRPEARSRPSSKLKVGEGLVGTIAGEAQLLNLADAQAHPAFKYLPETGEEIYNSFLGVPILRNGIVIGVLVVQNRTRRHYTEEEEEALQTTAMVLAEIIASGELRKWRATSPPTSPMCAAITSRAMRWPTASHSAMSCCTSRASSSTNLIAENIPKEKARLDEAIEQLRAHVDELVEGTDTRGGEYSEVLETFRMFAHDRGWVNRLRETVETGLTAEAAVERVQSDNRARMMRTPDPYLRERMHDLDDLANRLLRILTGQIATASRGDLPQNAIVVARNMGPAELLDYDRTKLRGVILEEGGRTSHVAIVARALGIPAPARPRASSISSIPARRSSLDGDIGRCLCPPFARNRARLCRQGALQRPAPGAVRGACATRQADDPRWGQDRARHQCRSPCRSAASARIRERTASACSAPSCNS